ncbi:VWA domain-containing protein [Peredibacter sp. HCB2-198]|uniref:VWA domain-containing protein n=1 Tax=Peredibacter sp. HCB2-198 TaxID=3383025 RepID=UPI0038B4453C
MEFKNPLLLWAGVIAGIIWAIDYWKIFQRAQLYFPLNQHKVSWWKNGLRIVLFLIGVVGWGYLSYSLMQPRKAQKFSPSSVEVNDIVLCIDVSRSMLAEDIRPNRLEVAKERIREFARLRPTDRISIVIFSEKVFTLLPLTTDPSLVDKVLSEISIGYLGSGTNIGDGLALSVARAVNSDTKNKVIVLLTDGVANVGTMTPMQAAEEAKKYGIKVYTIGLGTDEDAKIPVGNGIFGTQYQLIPGGSIDYKVLKEISDLTGGKFYPAKSEKALRDILDDIQKLEKTEIKVNHQVVYDEKYYSYLLMGVALIFGVEVLRRLLLKDVV